MPTLRSASLLPLLLAAWLPAQAVNDTLVKTDGARQRGVEVTALTLTGVKFKKGTEESEIPAYQLTSVEWGNAPESFAGGLAAMTRGDFENARQLFGDAAEKSTRPVLQAEARFQQCRAAVAAAGADPSSAANAAQALESWVAANADGWRLPEALLLVGRAKRLAGDHAGAQSALKSLEDRAGNENWGMVWTARAKQEAARSLLAQDKAGEARSAFQAAGNAAGLALGSPSGFEAELRQIQVTARVGEGETYIGDKDFNRALDYFRNLATSERSPALIAAGKAGEGEALYLQHEAAKDANGLRAAQMALASACVLDSEGNAAAKANYYLGMCLLALGSEREGDSFRARANGYFQLVTQHYSQSRFAGLAKAQLAK